MPFQTNKTYFYEIKNKDILMKPETFLSLHSTKTLMLQKVHKYIVKVIHKMCKRNE